MHFMLQKEVVTRLAARPGNKSFGRLSVMVQYYCEVEHLFDVPPSAFDPPPKVESAVVRFIPYPQSPYPAVDHPILEAVVARAFSMRRKTLANNLKPILPASTIERLGIDPKLRPEQLQISDFVLLAQALNSSMHF
jgi:16S rRNA (adenine1518-N6/adenine1519-N6)-dimethyltransferase